MTLDLDKMMKYQYFLESVRGPVKAQAGEPLRTLPRPSNKVGCLNVSARVPPQRDSNPAVLLGRWLQVRCEGCALKA